MTKVEGDKEVTGETITNSIGNSGSAVTMNDDLDVNTNNISNATTIETDTLQVNPQTPAPSINNSLWVDSGDSNKLKHRDNGGTSYEVVDFSHVGTGANQIVQLNGSAQLPAIDGSNLTGVGGGQAGMNTGVFDLIKDLNESATLTTDTIFTNVAFENMKDATLTLTNCIQITDGTIAQGAVLLDIDDTGAATVSCDFTGGTLDPAFSLIASGGTSTFDAVNDEVDMVTGTSNGTYGGLRYSTAVTNSVIKVGVRNIATPANTLYLFLNKGNAWIRANTDTLSVTTVIGGSQSYSSNTIVYLRLTTIGNWMKGEVSDDNSIWTTIAEGYLLNANNSAQPDVRHQQLSDSSARNASAFLFEIWDEFYTSGTAELTTARTALTTASLGTLRWRAITPTNSNVTGEISADNGSNYDSCVNGDNADITNTGTQIKFKMTLTQSATAVTPQLDFVGFGWN